MFTTILGQVTRFFDRRAIVSGFAPTALFWGLALAAAAAATLGWKGSLDWWTAQSGTAKAVLLTAAVAWLVVFAILTVNWHVALIRTFEGYWPDSRPWQWLDKALRERSRKRWDMLDEEDKKLEGKLVSLREQKDLPGADVEELDRKIAEAEGERQPFSRKLFLYFPPREAIMPTRLGNVLRSAERYSWERYRLDSIVVWPRLEATFDDGLPDPLLDSRTSLDLMVTISAFAILFGIPIAGGLGFGVEWDMPWWVPLAVVVLAALAKLWIPLAVALAAVALAALAGAISSGSDALHHVALGLLVLAAASFVAAVAYRNSVEAAVAYGEQIKAILDVHRWRVLKAFKLPMPSDVDEERELWTDISTFLYRGSRPQSKLYEYVSDEEKEEDS